MGLPVNHTNKWPKEVVEEQARNCMAMRREGATMQVIADTLGISLATVSRRVQQFLEANPAPDIESWRALQNEDLETARQKLMETIRDARNPDQMARMVDRLVKLQERQARLLGLDMPLQTEVTHVVQTEQEAELAALFAQMDQQNAEGLSELEKMANQGEAGL